MSLSARFKITTFQSARRSIVNQTIFYNYLFKAILHVYAADNYTLVTALMDIGRDKWPSFRRSNKLYLAYGLRLLQLNVPLVIFVERQFIDFVRFHRRDKKHVTHVVATTFEELEYFALYSRIKTVMHYIQRSVGDSPFSQHPEVFSPEYVIMMASKVSLLKQTIDMNPFRSSYFYWIDFGIIRSDSDLPFPLSALCIPPPRFISEPEAQGKIVYTSTKPINSTLKNVAELIANRSSPYVKASLFGGQSEPVMQYHALYRQVFERWLAANLTDDDQSLMVACYFEQPDLFYFFQQSTKCYLCNVFVYSSD
jgi:hypothetical protein